MSDDWQPLPGALERGPELFDRLGYPDPIRQDWMSDEEFDSIVDGRPPWTWRYSDGTIVSSLVPSRLLSTGDSPARGMIAVSPGDPGYAFYEDEIDPVYDAYRPGAPVTADASELAQHDAVFLSGRRTPKIVKRGERYRPSEAEGRIVKRRPCTQEEERTIRNGGWVRVNVDGKRPGDPGYKDRKSKIRPNLSTEGQDE